MKTHKTQGSNSTRAKAENIARQIRAVLKQTKNYVPETFKCIITIPSALDTPSKEVIKRVVHSWQSEQYKANNQIRKMHYLKIMIVN